MRFTSCYEIHVANEAFFGGWPEIVRLHDSSGDSNGTEEDSGHYTTHI